MKKMILTAVVAFSGFAFAGTVGYVTTSTDEASIQATVTSINNGTHSSVGRNCKVFAVEIKNGGYRVDRFGNLEKVDAQALVKYQCKDRKY